LVPVVAVAGAAALIVAGALAGVFADDLYRAQKAREVTLQARVVAASVSAALAFDDRAMEAQFIGALRANPEIDFAGIYDEQGQLVASYLRPDASRAAQKVTVTVPVVQAGSRLGSVRLVAELEPVARRLLRYAFVALLTGMAALLLSGLAAAHGVLRRANQALAKANQALRDEIAHREAIEETLRQGQKMEAIGRLTGGVAHDFNNLLMIASSGLELLDRTDDPERRKVLKEGIRQAVDRGASLTRQLLAFSRRSPLHPEVVSLPGRIEGMRVLLERSLREDVGVDFDIDPELWPVEVDPGQLELAILNLAVNARDAMPQGGRVTISARNLPGYADGVLSGDFVRLSVSDAGVGMSPETLSRVFEPFFTTKGAGQGTGLGLSQVYGFTKASGGDVRIESRVGEGTSVSLLLPRSRSAVTAPVPRPAAEPVRTGPACLVLLVEDDDGVAAMVTGMLQELGCTVERASNAEDALRRLETGRSFGLVFTDTVMPGAMNGMELAREVGRRRPGLPVLMTTGYSEAATAAMRDGLRLLVKPYTLETLATELKAALGESRRAPVPGVAGERVRPAAEP
jgi:signal transduction histidine kinase/ActR/RegA family two-component response regulator